MLKSLRHPRVVLFMGACLNPGNLAIVTEYLPRNSLYQVLWVWVWVWVGVGVCVGGCVCVCVCVSVSVCVCLA